MELGDDRQHADQRDGHAEELQRPRPVAEQEKLAATMKAGATEPTTPMLRAVVYCRATNCRVPKAAPPVSDRNTMTPALALSFGRSA